MSEELGGYPTQTLIDELEKRFPNYIFIGQRVGLKQKGKVVSKYYSGDIIRCLGFLPVAHDFLMIHYRRIFENVSENEI